MGSLYWHRDRVLVAVGASGVAVRRMRREGRGHRAPGFSGSANLEWRGLLPRQKSPAVPAFNGESPPHANNLWQCQSRVARTPSTPRNIGSARAEWLLPDKPGSANLEWRMGDPRQKSLAAPAFNGATSRKLALPAAPIIGSPCPTLSTVQLAQDLFSPAGIKQPRTKLPLGNMMLCCGNPISNVLHRIELPNEFLERSSVHHLSTSQRKARYNQAPG